MRLLLDACVAAPVRATLEQAGHDVVCVADWPGTPADQDVLDRAYAEQRATITLDKDFGELAIVMGRPHSGILRVVNMRAAAQASLINAVVSRYHRELQAGAIITVEPGRVRVRATEENQQ